MKSKLGALGAAFLSLFVFGCEDNEAGGCMETENQKATSFAVDCRCIPMGWTNTDIRECVNPADLVSDADDKRDILAGKYGTGPHIWENDGSMIKAEAFSGFFDESSREILIAVRHRAGLAKKDLATENAYLKDVSTLGWNGFIMAIHADTGNRRIVSGDAYSQEEQMVVKYGDGPRFNGPLSVVKGPAGKLYVVDNLGNGRSQLFRIDPQSGDRELVWSNEPGIYSQEQFNFGQCDHGRHGGSFDVQARAIPLNNDFQDVVVDKDGNFYLNFAEAGYETGRGLIKVSSDGSACSYFSATGASERNDLFNEEIGSGTDFGQGSLSRLKLYDGQIYATNFINKTFYRIDIETGARRRIAGGIEAYTDFMPVPGNPDQWLFFGSNANFPKMQLLHVADEAVENLYLPTKWAQGVLGTQSHHRGGAFFDPKNPNMIYFVHQNKALLKGEWDSYNNYVFSL